MGMNRVLCENEVNRLRDALDHIARVAMGSATNSRRAAWIAARAKSALNGDDDWRSIRKPKGYHDALERGPNVQIEPRR